MVNNRCRLDGATCPARGKPCENLGRQGKIACDLFHKLPEERQGEILDNAARGRDPLTGERKR